MNVFYDQFYQNQMKNIHSMGQNLIDALTCSITFTAPICTELIGAQWH